MLLDGEFNFTAREEDLFSSTKTSVVISLLVLTVKYLLRNNPVFFLRSSGHLHGTKEAPPLTGPCKYVMSSSDNYNAWVCIQ